MAAKTPSIAEELSDILHAAIQDEINREIVGILSGNIAAPPAPPPLPNPGTLWVVRYEDGVLGVRGHGTLCRAFFQHARSLVIHERDDWPWSYMRLKPDIGLLQLIEGFEDYFSDYYGEDEC